MCMSSARSSKKWTRNCSWSPFCRRLRRRGAMMRANAFFLSPAWTDLWDPWSDDHPHSHLTSRYIQQFHRASHYRYLWEMFFFFFFENDKPGTFVATSHFNFQWILKFPCGWWLDAADVDSSAWGSGWSPNFYSSSRRPSFHLSILFDSCIDAGFIHTNSSFYKNEKLTRPLRKKVKWGVSEGSG